MKARVVRASPRKGNLALHLKYLQREGVTQGGESAQMFDANGEADAKTFAERCADDRHHFRFIVSPDDAEKLSDLRAFARDLMAQAEKDLGTRLDWIGVDHWNTGHPHLHLLVRGRGEDGTDLVISRDYISRGLRARAAELVQLELGPRTEVEVRERMMRQLDANRWTALDRQLVARSQEGVIDLRLPVGAGADPAVQIAIGRVRHLEALGLATPQGPGRWRLAPDVETTLRDLGREGDIIARLHAGMTAQGRALNLPDLRLGSEAVLGRLAMRGHDDELAGTGYAVVEGLDGGLHHVGLRDLADASDAAPGAIVELRRLPGGRQVLAVRSDLSLSEQITAQGATWLDRRLLVGDVAIGGADDFGREVRGALAARAEHLVGAGLARRQQGRLVLARALLATLEARELDAVAAGIASETGLSRQRPAAGEEISGVYRRRLDLASGRFALLEGGSGFALAPWRPDLEARFGQVIDGVVQESGRVSWSRPRDRSLQL